MRDRLRRFGAVSGQLDSSANFRPFGARVGTIPMIKKTLMHAWRASSRGTALTVAAADAHAVRHEKPSIIHTRRTIVSLTTLTQTRAVARVTRAALPLAMPRTTNNACWTVLTRSASFSLSLSLSLSLLISSSMPLLLPLSPYF